MERNAARIGVLVIASAFGMTVAATAAILSDNVTASASQPMHLTDTSRVVTNKAAKKDRIALAVAAKPSDTQCTSHARVTTCITSTGAGQLARLD